MEYRHAIPVMLLATLLGGIMDLSAQSVSTSKDTRGVSLTIYNQNFAVVREKRDLFLRSGRTSVRFEDVAAKIDATSLSFKSLTDPNGVVVREQNYQYDLLTPQAVLDKSIGKTVRYRQVNPDGKEHILEGTVLSTNSGTVIRTDDGQIILNPWGELTVEEMPDGLVSKPSLLWLLDVDEGGKHESEVSYITEGMGWDADYVAVVTDDESKVDLTGWVTLENKSGATYKSAQLQLLAGDVRRVQEQPVFEAEYMMMDAAAEAPAPQFEEESFFEYHLYTLDGTTDVRDNETKQMTLMSAANVGVTRKLTFDGGRPWYYSYGNRQPGQGSSSDDIKAAIILELENSKANNMGMPLPKGKVRVYKADKRNNLQFLGEDLIDHTPKDETVRLYIGDAFDVVGSRLKETHKQISKRVHEETWKINVRNHKDEAQKVWVVEHLYGDWSIVEKSHDFNKIDATTIEFPVTIPPNGEVTVKYTARMTW